MRRRGDVGGVAGPARGVEADAARRQVGAQVGGEITGRAIVGADQQRRATGEPAIVLEQRRQQQRSQHRRGRAPRPSRRPSAGVAHAAAERVDALVLGGDLDQWAEAHEGRRCRIGWAGMRLDS